MKVLFAFKILGNINFIGRSKSHYSQNYYNKIKKKATTGICFKKVKPTKNREGYFNKFQETKFLINISIIRNFHFLRMLMAKMSELT